MQMKQILAVLAIAILTYAQNQPSKPSLAKVIAVTPSYVHGDGVWDYDHPHHSDLLKQSVGTHIECQRHGGLRIVGTDPFCLVATAFPAEGNTVFINTDVLKVVEWDREIIAVNDCPECQTSQITIDLTSKTVSGLDIRKLGVKGGLIECKEFPDRETYYLRNVYDYADAHK